MNPIRRILVPVDFSDCSVEAAGVAARLAERLGAQVELLAVAETALLLGGDGLVMPQEAIAELRRTAETELRAFRQKHFGNLAAVNTLVRDGGVLTEILAAARLTRADLIVMGTHGRSGLAHFLMGSIAEKVVRKSPVPVLTVGMPGEGKTAPRNVSRILVPTDFSECSAASAAAAAGLAKELGAKLTLLAVVDTSPLREIYGDEKYLNERLALVLARARENLDAFARKHLAGFPDAAREVREGRAHTEIIAAAAECGADLIVIGTHGRSAVPHLLLGSVAEKVLRKSPVPVLTVRALPTAENGAVGRAADPTNAGA